MSCIGNGLRAVLLLAAVLSLTCLATTARAQDSGSEGSVSVTVNQVAGYVTVQVQAELGYDTSNARIWIGDDYSTGECTSVDDFISSPAPGYWLAGDEDGGEPIYGSSYEETWHFKPGRSASKRGAWRVCAFLQWDGSETGGNEEQTYTASFSDNDVGWFYITRPCSGAYRKFTGAGKTGEFVRVSVNGVSGASCGFGRAQAQRVLRAWPSFDLSDNAGYVWWPPMDDYLEVSGPANLAGPGHRKVLYERLGFDSGVFQSYSDDDYRFAELSLYHEPTYAYLASCGGFNGPIFCQ